MKMHSKTVIVLISTLLIGLAIGALGWSGVHNYRAEQLDRMRREGGFYGSITRYIEPEDSVQEKQLRTLATAYQDTLGPFWRHYMRHRVVLMESFEEELLPILSEPQKEKLQPYLERITTLPESARRTPRPSSDSTAVDSTAVDSTAVDSTATAQADSSSSQ